MLSVPLALLSGLAHGQEAASAPVAADTAVTRAESKHWTVEMLSPPEGVVLEIGGMDWMPDGRLALSTRRGQVWMVENALAEDPADARFSLYAEGLQEGLGLNVLEVPDGEGGTRHALYVLQRGEITELRDDDEDGRAETWVRVADDWGLSGNYHEFAFGLPDDGHGNLFVSLNVGFLDPEWWLGRSAVPWRGWVLRIDPVTGQAEPWASGFRSPCGLGIDSQGQLLLTDNQGDWMASTPVFAVQRGGFHGHPASLDWTPEFLDHGLRASLEQPPETRRTPPAIWIPYEWSRSPGNLVPLPEDGAFGSFTNQMVMAELTNGHLMRVQFEEIAGVKQGAVIPLRQRLGSVVRVLFADNGTLFGGLTNRGWGGLAPDNGLLRVTPTGTPPMEMDRVHLVPEGFEISFTEPLAADVDINPEIATVEQYDYDYWWEYGSPERHRTDVAVTAASLSPDRRTLSIKVPELRAAMVARITLNEVRGAPSPMLSGEENRPLLHNEVAYTVNQLADGSRTDALVAKAVPPPPSNQSGKEGWLRLTYGNALDAWESTGWALVDAELHPDDRQSFLVTPGVNALVNTGRGSASDYVSRWDFGSGTYHVEFMLPEGGQSAVSVHGRHTIELRDDTHGLPEGALGSGAIRPDLDGSRSARAPETDAYSGAGHWHELEIDFLSPEFDTTGKKIAEARFAEVRLDGTMIHKDVTLTEATSVDPGRVAGPLVIAGQNGPVALRTLEFLPTRAIDEYKEWMSLIGGDDLNGWTTLPANTRTDTEGEESAWLLEDGELIGEGAASWLLSPRGDYRDVSVHAQVRINDGGDAGLIVRAAHDGDRVMGYEAQIITSFSDPSRTGGLQELAPVKVQLVPAGSWFDLDVHVADEAEGTRITVAVNGVTTADYLDTNRRFTSGHIALQQHHEGGVLRVRDLRVDAR
jgi:glucose/arabinose dehydrogenase